MQKTTFQLLAIGMLAILMVSCKTEPPKSVVKHYEFKDQDGNVTTSKDYQYDENGNLLSVTEHNGGNSYDNSDKVMYKYDENNHMLSETYYYDGDATMRSVYTYNENGDTTSFTHAYKEENKWVINDKTTYEYQEGVLTHKYEYHNCLSEGDGPGYDMVTDHSYDKDGKETAATFYNLSGDNDVYSIEISEAAAASPANEYKQILTDNNLDIEGKITYSYNSDGKLVSVNRSDNQNSTLKITNEYDASGNLKKSISERSYDGSDAYTTTSEYSYNQNGKCTKCVNTTPDSDYSDVCEWEYDENGDTLSVVTVYNYEGNSSVSKVRYTYSAPGVKKYIYHYSTSDDYGYENQSVCKEEYNEKGQIISCVQYDLTNYDEDYAIEKENSGNAEEEMKHYISKYNMKKFSTESYTYEEIVVDHSFAAKVKGFFSGGGDKNKKDATKGEDGVEYDI